MGEKFTYEYVKEYIESFGYKLISNEYKNTSEKIEVECPHGHRYPVTLRNFRKGRRCPYCSRHIRLTYEEVKTYVENFGYKLLSNEYVTCEEPLLIQCDKGHSPYMASYDNFVRRNSRCPYCNGGSQLPYWYVKEQFKNEGYELLSDTYINCTTKLTTKCPNGHIYEVTYNNFINHKHRCRSCTRKRSKGELEVEGVLNKLKIKYIAEKTFEDLVYKRHMRFDFYLVKENVCIEYDGKQHFEPVNFKGAMSQDEVIESFKINQLKDKMKDEYCDKNNIPLIRIPYTINYKHIEKVLLDNLTRITSNDYLEREYGISI